MGDSKVNYESLIPYIPRTILNWYRNSAGEEVHVVSRHEGCVLCIDATGFTALTKELSSRGKEGPEILTKVLNLFFQGVSDVVFRYGGDVLKFAGDALWAFFPHTFDIGGFFSDVLGAIEDVNSSPHLKNYDRLSVHIGAEAGRFYMASLGDPGLRLEAEPLGNLLGTVYRACDAAGENELAVGPTLAQQCAETSELVSIGGEFNLVIPRRGTAYSTTTSEQSHPGKLTADYSLLKLYIPQDVLAKIETSVVSTSVQGEHRQVVVLFASFENNVGRKSDNAVSAVHLLNQKLLSAFETIRHLHGSIARIDPFKRGHKLLVLFGAPTKRENDEINALLCARKLIELSDDSFRIRAGLAIGPLFCGNVGAERRREYTVMGDGVNLAARLMAKTTWNEIFIGPALRERLPDEVLTKPVVLDLKGFKARVTCHQFIGVSETNTLTEKSASIIGQKSETEMLATAWAATSHGQKQLVAVTGPAGIGKSILLSNFSHSHHEADAIQLQGKNSPLFGRGWLARKLLQKLLEGNNSEAAKDLEHFILGLMEPRWLPLLSDILETETQENQWTRGLTPDLRLSKTKELLGALLGELVTASRLVVVDDFGMIDEFFRLLVSSLAESETELPLMVVIIAREVNSLQLSDKTLASFKILNVTGPTDDQWWNYFSENFSDGKRERELFERILAAAKGNPHFIMQFLEHCALETKLVSNKVTNRWELAASGLQITVPDSLVNLHLSIFDGLPEIERTIMKAASVAVGDFSPGLIQHGVSDLAASAIENHLENLAVAGLLQSLPDKKRFSFTHTSMREAIYQCIPESQLQKLHQRFAEIVEQKASHRHLNLLAYHFFRARIFSKGFQYSLEAGSQSLTNYALTETADYFQQCLKILEEADADSFEVSQRLSFYRQYAQFLTLEGQYTKAYPILRQWRRLSRDKELMEESLLAAIETATLLWFQSKYPRSRKVLNRVLAYVEGHGDQRANAKALYTLCQLERRAGNFAEAEKAGEAAVGMATRLGDREILTEARMRLGLTYWGAGKLDAAATTFEDFIQSEQEDNKRLAMAQNNLAIIEQERGHFLQAETLATKALDLLRSIGDRLYEGYVSGNLGNLSRIFGKLIKAEELFLQADLIFERLDDRHAHFYTVGNLGDVDMIRGDLTSAEHRFRLAADFASEVEDRELAAECDVRFGELAFFKGEIADAEARYQKAIVISEEIGSTEYLTRACVGLARLLIGERNHEKAMHTIQRISELSRNSNAVLSENEAIFLTGENHRIRHEYESAAVCYSRALAYAQSQDLFELILKCAVRLHETQPNSREHMATILNQLRSYFVENNSLPAWDQLARSAYFSYFAETLQSLVGTAPLFVSPTP